MVALDHYEKLLPKLRKMKGMHTFKHIYPTLLQKPINTFYGLR